MKKYPLQNCKKSLGRYLVAILNTLNLNEFARLLSQYVCNIDVNIDVLCFVLFQSEITFRFHPIGARTVSWGVTAQAAAAAKEFTWLLWQRSLQVNDGCNKFVWLGWFLPGTVSEWKTGLLVYLLPCSLSDGTKYERQLLKKHMFLCISSRWWLTQTVLATMQVTKDSKSEYPAKMLVDIHLPPKRILPIQKSHDSHCCLLLHLAAMSLFLGLVAVSPFCQNTAERDRDLALSNRLLAKPSWHQGSIWSRTNTQQPNHRGLDH